MLSLFNNNNHFFLNIYTTHTQPLLLQFACDPTATTVTTHILAGNILRSHHTAQRHRPVQLVAQNVQHPFDAALTIHRQTPQHRSADEHTAGAQRQRLKHIGAVADAAVQHHGDAIANRGDDLGQGVDLRPREME